MNDMLISKKGKLLPYNRFLRTLGQVLEPAKLHDFELQVTDEGLVVTFQNSLPQSSWQWLRRYFVHEPNEPNTELRYSRAELEQLEYQYRELAVDGNRIPDRYSLPQILRVVGTYVDKKQADLISLSRRAASLLITYRNPNGEIRTDDLLYLDVDGIFVRELRLRQCKDASTRDDSVNRDAPLPPS